MSGDPVPGPGSRIRWLAGEPEVCEALAQAWDDPAAAGATLTELRDRPERRRLLRLRWPGGRDLFVKQFYMAGQRHRARKRLVRLLHVEAARREWRALSRLARAGVPVPAPRALGILPGGDRILAVDFLAGRALDSAVSDAEHATASKAGGAQRGRGQAQLADQLGRLVAALHAQGIVHRDLHHGNVFLAETGPVLLDLQLARPGRSHRARLRDVGDLEASLESSFSLAWRVRFRAAALGLSRPFDTAARQALRDAGTASLARARAHAASRCRRALRPGRRFARVTHAAGRGLRVRELEPAALEQALRAHAQGQGAALQRGAGARVTAVAAGGRAVVVKQTLPAGIARSLADLLRGSAARRAWLAGFGLESHGIGAARPLAFLERRRLGLPRGSLLVMEDLRPARPAPELAASHGAQVLDVLARLIQRLHARGIRHDDLTADHVWLSQHGVALEPRLSNLERVGFRDRLSDAERKHGLARVNATLPDSVDPAARLRAFGRYALLLPFSGGRDAALAEVVAESLADGGRWSGAGCRHAGSLSRAGRR